MEATITSIRENPLLGRKKVKVKLDHEGESTPSEEDVKTRMAAEKDLDPEKVEIDSIYTGYGSQSSEAIMQVYQEFEYDEELKEEPAEEQGAELEISEDYKEAVSGTITDAKDALDNMDSVDWNTAIKAEKENKDRATLVEWLENQR